MQPKSLQQQISSKLNLGISFAPSEKYLKPFSRIIVIVLLALAYYGTAELSRHVASTPQSVTPVWPPDGFAAAAILIFGYQALPGVLIGSFLANIWAFFNPENFVTAIASILVVLGVAIGTTTGIGIGNYLLRQSIPKNPFKTLEGVCKFLLIIGIFTPSINATFGVIFLCLAKAIPWSISHQVWSTWWISNVSGICIFTPALLSWYELLNVGFHLFYNNQYLLLFQAITKRKKELQTRALEAIALIIIVVTLSYTCFFQVNDLAYIFIPCLVWAVLRFGQFFGTNLLVFISVVAVLGTVRGLGIFVRQDTNQSLIALQSFVVVVTVSTLILIAALVEREQIFITLQQSERSLLQKSMQLEDSQENLHKTALILVEQNTELIEAKKVAENANHAKTEFLSNMSHELRTPLNAILGLVQLLKESQNLDPLEKDELQIIHESGVHLLHLIEDILDISKIEAGKMELHYQKTNLLAFLESLVSTVRLEANHKKIAFNHEFSPNLPPLVLTDAKRLKQILLNLLNNAIKFTNVGQVIFRVEVQSLKQDNDNPKKHSALINFEIVDSGIGIHKNKLESIFLPFEQTGETTFKVQGTGLGLAISQNLAAMMGGNITVESQYGVGSKFNLWVALEVLEAQNTSQNPTIPKPNFETKQSLAEELPLKILLAEDNIVNQKVATKILNRLGYTIDIANNGIEVLEIIKQNNYDVILMDIQMPEMDGIETTKRLLELPHCPYIIALTANVMDRDRLMCLAAGMNDYLSKPINIDALVQALWRSQETKIEIPASLQQEDL